MNIRFYKCAYILALSICFRGTDAFLKNGTQDDSSKAIDVHERVEEKSLLKEENVQRRYVRDTQEEVKECAERSIDDFPEDWFTDEQRRHGAVILHAFLGFYCFLLTAITCHNYLLPSLEHICTSMNISTDVAGATFLAMASSFPELFVNVIGTFLTETDLGAGTVVGSAVFDTFATPACGALTALTAIPLQWRILTRDCMVYVISVGTLVIVMWDQRIAWYEAMSLLIIFVVYLIVLFGSRSVNRCCRKDSFFGSKAKHSDIDEASSPNGSYTPQKEISVIYHTEKQQDTKHDVERRQECSETSEEHSESENLFVWPKDRSLIGKFWFLLCWPAKFLLFVSIPDCRIERLKNWYPLTFVMCVIWIGIASYLVSWMMTVIGDTIGIPDSIMGLTFLAAGGNIPELASIVILSRQGDGNMAMSNTLGANILDILLCLGLPWLIKCLMTGRDVEIVSGALSYSVLSIVVCIVALYAVIAFFNFSLNKKVGLICLLLYTTFLTFAILVEMNVFSVVNLPMCD
ncbi:sodium/potassium/calcium exchanger 5 [Megachile rotundata]|uniref:sodium/potassium/calcium exchanger 5 n=1 Tax=Megachile rotundata TaxID=143995 RepID=UPI003FD09770